MKRSGTTPISEKINTATKNIANGLVGLLKKTMIAHAKYDEINDKPQKTSNFFILHLAEAFIC